MEIDLHRTLSPGPLAHLVRLDDLWQAPTAVAIVPGRTIPALDPDAAFLHACLHIATDRRRARLADAPRPRRDRPGSQPGAQRHPRSALACDGCGAGGSRDRRRTRAGRSGRIARVVGHPGPQPRGASARRGLHAGAVRWPPRPCWAPPRSRPAAEARVCVGVERARPDQPTRPPSVAGYASPTLAREADVSTRQMPRQLSRVGRSPLAVLVGVAGFVVALAFAMNASSYDIWGASGWGRCCSPSPSRSPERWPGRRTTRASVVSCSSRSAPR